MNDLLWLYRPQKPLYFILIRKMDWSSCLWMTPKDCKYFESTISLQWLSYPVKCVSEVILFTKLLRFSPTSHWEVNLFGWSYDFDIFPHDLFWVCTSSVFYFWSFFFLSAWVLEKNPASTSYTFTSWLCVESHLTPGRLWHLSSLKPIICGEVLGISVLLCTHWWCLVSLTQWT